MRTTTIALGLLSLLAACGGRVDDAPTSPSGSAYPAPPGPGASAPPSSGDTVASPEEVANNVGAPSALALSDDAVVFTTHDTVLGGVLVEAGALFVADKRVGPALMIAVDREGAHYDALAVDAESAYVGSSDGRVIRVPLRGGADVELADLPGAIVALKVSGDKVYAAQDSGAITMLPVGGGEVVDLGSVDGLVRGLEVDEDAIYAATVRPADATRGGGVVRLERGSRATSVLAGSDGACSITREGENLYWTSLVGASSERGLGEVKTVALGSQTVSTVASGAFDACAIASDAQSLWFSTTTLGALSVRSGGARSEIGVGLMRAPVSGGVPVAVNEAGSALVTPGAVAVDATHLYWLTATGVLKLRK